MVNVAVLAALLLHVPRVEQRVIPDQPHEQGVTVRPVILLLMFAALAERAHAEPPKVEVVPSVEITTKVCDYAEVAIKTNGVGVLWQVPDGVKRFDPKKLVDPNTAYFKFPKVGVYWLNVVVASVADGKVEFAEQKIKVTVVGDSVEPVKPEPVVPPVPDPKPVPVPDPPKPDPKPEPIATSKLAIVFVEETSDAADERGKFFGDKKLASKIEERGHKVLAIDKDVKDKNGAVPAKLVGYLNEAKGKKLPWIVIVNADNGKMVFSGPVPSGNETNTAEELMLVLLTKYGG